MPILKVWDEETQKYIGIPAIKGEKGEKGEKGDTGPQGPQGEPGISTKVNGIAPDATGNVNLTAADVGALAVSGGDMTGEIRMNGQPISGLSSPTEDTQAATKAYADKMLPKTGGTMTGAINMNGQPISGLNDPTEDTQAARKGYVDSKRKTWTITITTTWSGSGPYTQSVTVSGILASDMPHITPVYSSDNTTALSQKEAWAYVSKAVTAENSITFACFEDKPAMEIPIQIEVMR